MAKARPVSPVRDRALAAFRKAMPGYEHNVRAFKVRSRQFIRVYGSTLNDTKCITWHYGKSGRLERVENTYRGKDCK